MTGTTKEITLSEGPAGGVSGKKKIVGENELQTLFASVITANADLIASRILDFLVLEYAVDRVWLRQEGKISGEGPKRADIIFDIPALEEFLGSPRSEKDDIPEMSYSEIDGVAAGTRFFPTLMESICFETDPRHSLGWMYWDLLRAIIDEGIDGLTVSLPRFGIAHKCL